MNYVKYKLIALLPMWGGDDVGDAKVLINAVIGKVGPGTDGFRQRDQTRIKTPPL